MVSPTSETVLHDRAADILRQARSLPPGADRNDLRQIAIGLRWLERNGSESVRAQTAGNLSHEDTGPGDR